MDWSALPPLSSLRAFEAAARHLSFTAAGRELNVTHAAVAQQVRKLEAALGIALIRREGRGLALTVEGGRLAQGLGEGLARVRDAVAEIVDSAGERPLRVTMTPKFAGTWMLPRLAGFRSENPDIELMLNPTPARIDLTAEDYDLAIRYGDGNWPGLEVEPLMPSNFVVVAAASLVADRPVETPADLLRLPWLVELDTDDMAAWLRNHGVDLAKKRDKHDITHLPGYMLGPALRSGQGAACTARVLLEDDIASGELVVLFEDRNPSTGYHLARRPGPVRPAVRRLVAWLKREVARPAAVHTR